MRQPRVKLNMLDKFACAVSPSWGAKRVSNKLRLSAFNETGYVVPGSSRKSMKGVTARTGSPDSDIVPKLDGMRALSRDLTMNSPLAVSILRRHKHLTIGAGLQVQSVIDQQFLDLDVEQASKYEHEFEREFDLWAESTYSDVDRINFYGDNQALGYFNLLLNGDFFFMLPWSNKGASGYPYETALKLIDADLVRDPIDQSSVYAHADIQGGVEKDSAGTVVAYHVWNSYPCDTYRSDKRSSSTRIAVFDAAGDQQIWHVCDPERISQRRGVPLLAPAADALKQLTRLSEAELMSALLASFFTVFVRDMSGLGAVMGPALTPEETIAGGGRYSPTESEVGERYAEDGNDLEMGHGNVTYLDEKKEIDIADPGKTDKNFDAFFTSLAKQICAAGNAPFEQVMLNYQSSYTAAKAASNDVWNYRTAARTVMNRKMNAVVYKAVLTEGILKGRLQAPRFFEDYAYTCAYLRAQWVGSGQGALDPLREAKASVISLNAFLTTHEQEYVAKHGGRWDTAMMQRAREEKQLDALELGTNDLVLTSSPEVSEEDIIDDTEESLEDANDKGF